MPDSDQIPALTDPPPRPEPDSSSAAVAIIPPAADVGPAVAPAPEYPLDLALALRLAEDQNPEIATSRTRVVEALATQQQARALLLPTLNAGANYHGHDGNLERSNGRIIRLSEQSLYVGAGALTLGTQTVAIPGINISGALADALYEPLAARQRVAASQAEVVATSNNVLLEVAKLYLDLAGAEALVEAQRLSEAQTREVYRVTAAFAATRQGRPADAERAATDTTLRRGEVQEAEEELAVAAARLSRRLNLDPAIRLRALPAPLTPLCLIEPDEEPSELLRIALRRRPEVLALSATVAGAEVRVKQEVARPWLPTIWLGFSGGGFGGGSNLQTPLLGRFGGRTDFDVRLYWTALNFGYGNLAMQNRRRAQLNEALAARARAINEIREQVTSARAESLAYRGQVDSARRALKAAEDGFRQDLEQSRERLGRPIEVLNNLNLLARARRELIRAIILNNEAQFSLFVSLGSPPPLGAEAPPAGPPPIATPLHSPIISGAAGDAPRGGP